MGLGRSLGWLVSVLSAGLVAAPGIAQAQNWDASGVTRFGVFLQSANSRYSSSILDLTSGASLLQKADGMAYGVGIAAGYDWRFGNWVIGGEADVSFDNGSAKLLPSIRTEMNADFFATARARLGYHVTSGLLLYGTGGYGAQGSEFKTNTNPALGTGQAVLAKKTATLQGVVLGGGAEYDLGWGTAFVEYLHHDFEKWTFGGFSASQPLKLAIDGAQDVVRIGLKFKTGDDYGGDIHRRR